MFRVGVDAHQTTFVVLFFVEYLHQQVMFPLDFFHLADEMHFILPPNHMFEVLKGTNIKARHPVHCAALGKSIWL